MLNNIYGVDIDPQAVEVTKLGLLLKVLENETTESITHQLTLFSKGILPDLHKNIRCGNSLVGPDFYKTIQLTLDNEIQSRRINIFDWNDKTNGFGKILDEGGFDVIIGNPPYIQIQKLKEFYPEETEFIQNFYETTKEKNVDIYIPFIEKSLSLLKSNGLFGFINPNRFFNSDYGENIRKFLKDYNIYHLVNFRHYFVFEKSDSYTCLLFIQKRKQGKSLIYKEIRDLYTTDNNRMSYLLSEVKISEGNIIIDKIQPYFLNQDKWYFMTENEKRIFEKLIKNRKFLECYNLNFQGLITGMDKVYILKLLKEKKQTRIFFSNALNKNVELETGVTFNIIGDSDINKYYIDKSDNFIIFPYKDGKLFNNEELQKYPLTWNYLKLFERELRKREKGKFNNNSWYQFSRNQAIDKQRMRKILIPHVVKTTRAAFDDKGELFIKNVGVNGVTINEDIKEDEKYFLSILNSNIASFFISKTSIFLSGGFYATNKQFAGEIPIRIIDFSKKLEKDKHDKIFRFVTNIIELRKKLHKAKFRNEKELYERQIAAFNKQINEVLYELYGLNKEEINIIEENLKD